ncbi:uncharacterized protein PG998_002788 [Apiospora kogelbergensis]|uniref:uncharacterized protein n=1 Tax=Apiospora kogelbergensis TaxID=1337665 RepID=UPI0031326EE1
MASSPTAPAMTRPIGLTTTNPIIPGNTKSSSPAIIVKVSPIVSLAAGGLAGAVEAATTYPFEFAKTRAQLQSGGSKNPFAVLAQVSREHGFRSIYTGCSTLILGRLSPARGILAGMAAGAVESVVAVTPTERIKTALIDDAKSGKRQYKGGAHALSVMLRHQGIREVYRGLLSTTAKQSATSAVRMGSYNILKEMSKSRDLPQNSLTAFASGAVAGVITVYATQPLDTVKTRAQSARGAGTVEAIRSVISTGGVRGLWSGSSMRLGRLVLSGGIVFSVYEKVSAILS